MRENGHINRTCKRVNISGNMIPTFPREFYVVGVFSACLFCGRAAIVVVTAAEPQFKCWFCGKAAAVVNTAAKLHLNVGSATSPQLW